MPRPHLEFVQSQMLAWQMLDPRGGRDGVERKLLSEDPDSGATSNIFRYPPGWTTTARQQLACAEELYVLEGALTINDITYGPGDYAYLPSGHLRQSMHSTHGAAVVTFLEATLEVTTGDDLVGDGLISCVRSNELPWGSAVGSRLDTAGVGFKVLRLDPDNGDRTWLLNIEVSNGNAFEINGVERHPCVEETFLLSGDMAMPMGRMRDGAYFWRPSHIPHGPMGTETGFLGLFRCKEGGPFETEWSEADGPIDWAAPFSPIIPAGFAAGLNRDYDRAQRY
jgi:hypothetical protein